MASFPNVADLQYSGLYIPLFSIAYIQNRIGLPSELPFPVFDIVISSSNLWIFLSIAFVGALVNHGISKAIFGLEGPSKNPKNRWTVHWNQLLLLWKSEPGPRPSDPEDVSEKIDESLAWYNDLSRLGKTLFFVFRVPRIVIFGGFSILFTLLVYSLTLFLILEGVSGSLDYLGLVLAVSQTVFFLGGIILGRFPSVVEPNAAPWLFVPEYRKSAILEERDDVEFEYDPRGFWKPYVEMAEELIDEIQSESGEETETEYLIELDEKDTKYLVELDQDSK